MLDGKAGSGFSHLDCREIKEPWTVICLSLVFAVCLCVWAATESLAATM